MVFAIGFKGKVIPQPSAHVLRHTGPDTKSGYDMVLSFGSYNTLPTFWCRGLTPALLQEYGYILEELERAYIDLKLSSGRIRPEDMVRLHCGIHSVFASIFEQDVERHKVVVYLGV